MDLYNNESAEKRLRQSSTYMHWAFVDVLTNLSDVFSANFLSELPSMRLLPKRPQDKEGRTFIHVSQVYVRGKMHTVKTACSPQKGMPKEKDNSNLLRALYMPTTLDLRVLREKYMEITSSSLPHFGPQYPESFAISKRGTTTFQNDLTLSWIFLQGTYKVRELEGRAAGGD